VSPVRWLGLVSIVLGIYFISRSPVKITATAGSRPGGTFGDDKELKAKP